jgi:hypothetical protein
VSFQANKSRASFRWYKYKEAFSASLTELLISRCGIKRGPILDPFAGSGTALFVAAQLGLDAEGIELLPIGHQIIETRLLCQHLRPNEIARINRWTNSAIWSKRRVRSSLPELRITTGAYPENTKRDIECYLEALSAEPPAVGKLLRFALLCVLEGVSYTRKDGQYLRWDYRSGRRASEKQFDKGRIQQFDIAVTAKIREILNDIQSADKSKDMFSEVREKGNVRLLLGS